MQKIIITHGLAILLGISIAVIFFIAGGTGDSNGITDGLDSSVDTSIEIAEGITLADATAAEIVSAYIKLRERAAELEQLYSDSEITIGQLQASNKLITEGFNDLVRDIETIESGNTVITEESRAAINRVRKCIDNVRRLQEIEKTRRGGSLF